MQRSTSTTGCPVAAPQCISGRTSYLHVRLAFHPYPQLIPQFCNTGEFGPRRPFTAASPCRGAFHLSLSVLVHYRSLKVFSLGGWSPLLPTNAPGFVVLRMATRAQMPRPLRDSHPLGWCLPAPSGAPLGWLVLVLQPQHSEKCWFGLLPVRSPLLRESRLISLRQGTEMFQFPCCPPCGLCIQPPVARHHSGGVAPLGYSGLIARMQLPLNVSPVSASVFGLQRLGILLVLSVACSSALFFCSALLVSASAKLK